MQCMVYIENGPIWFFLVICLKIGKNLREKSSEIKYPYLRDHLRKKCPQFEEYIPLEETAATAKQKADEETNAAVKKKAAEKEPHGQAADKPAKKAAENNAEGLEKKEIVGLKRLEKKSL